MDSGSEITGLISDWQRGNRDAENALFEALYLRLHGIAAQCLRNEAPGHSMGPTMLVHEAYLRFERAERLEVADRGHFLALAARVMRRIVVDRARARRTEKRGGDQMHDDLDQAFASTDSEAEEILAVDRALESLTRQSVRQAQLVELRFFAGFNEDEAADALGISKRTVRREWQVARTRLRMAIDGTPTVL
ncbi:MAG TPA: ECF-type sigma factor [Candidatus Acidoferrum sp.]|jgi:RNA polymerase sigma-70 factor, ECF subfamily|nr:ECF-type sigma factor [Candidatus Acidoferrum sp.]